ncbi:MAG: hypothetical protein U1A77_07265 [Pirellulales bacterium]
MGTLTTSLGLLILSMQLITLMQSPLPTAVSWISICGVLFSTICLILLLKEKPDHWMLEALTVSGPVEIYGSKNEIEAIQLMASLSADLDRELALERDA